MTVVDRPAEQRFVLLRGDEELGELRYVRAPGQIELTHTGIDPEKREQGMGELLVTRALDEIGDDSTDRVIATCPFVAHVIEDNPAYRELLDR